LIITSVFKKIAIFSRKLEKIAENCDHNIGPQIADQLGVDRLDWWHRPWGKRQNPGSLEEKVQTMASFTIAFFSFAISCFYFIMAQASECTQTFIRRM
jgi:hypothetical protein